jgi:hypothetical protein
MSDRSFGSKFYRDGPDQVLRAMTEALKAIGARAASGESDYEVRAQIPVSIWSWGEEVAIQIVPSEEGATEVRVLSKSRFPITLFDWGKNAKNIEKLFAVLDQAGLTLSLQSAGAQPERSAPELERKRIEGELERLGRLKERQLITEDEYEEKRRGLVARL